MSVTVTTPGLMLTEHELSVPLDHARPDGERITVFAREVADPDGRDRPYLVYLQRGPGFEAPRPTRHPSGPGWLDRALQDYRERLLPAELREAPEFFTGEHVYPAGHEWPRRPLPRNTSPMCPSLGAAGCLSTMRVPTCAWQRASFETKSRAGVTRSLL